MCLAGFEFIIQSRCRGYFIFIFFNVLREREEIEKKEKAQQQRNYVFHTGTLSSWQLLLTLGCSSRALQVAPGPSSLAASNAPSPVFPFFFFRGCHWDCVDHLKMPNSVHLFQNERKSQSQSRKKGKKEKFKIWHFPSATAATDIHLLTLSSYPPRRFPSPPPYSELVEGKLTALSPNDHPTKIGRGTK